MRVVYRDEVYQHAGRTLLPRPAEQFIFVDRQSR